MSWNVVGVPIDCLGASPGSPRFGTELSPDALRSLGVVAAVGGLDRGDVAVRVVGSARDPETGLVGGKSVHDAVSGTRAAIADALSDEAKVLLLGGCCIPLMGALAGARDQRGEIGLVYVDGHLDLYDQSSSPTGEAADMPVAAVLGIGELGLLASMSAPVVKPQHLSVLGVHDPDEWPVVSHIVEELDLHVVEPPDIAGRTSDVATVAVDRAASAGSFWLHLDVDVFDETEFPATDYPMPNGLTLDVGLELLGAIGADDRLVGVSVGCYNPEKDTDGRNGRDVVNLLMAATSR